jgi:hypothetical protein
MATKIVDTDLSVVGKATQSGTPSAGGDLTTKTYVDAQVATRQASNTDLTDLVARWVAASAAGPASLAFAEDTDNGANVVTVTAPATIAADVVLTLPGTADTLVGRATTDTLTNKTLTSPVINTPTGIAKADVGLGNVDNTSNVTERAATATLTNKTLGTGTVIPIELMVALSDETTDLTTGVAKVTMRAPWAFTVTGVRSSVSTASSSGLVTVDINEAGATIMTTNKLSIDATEKTSTTAATAATVTDTAIANDAELTFDIDAAGTGAKGLKVVIYGTRVI